MKTDRERAFETIYESGYWEPGKASGHGSTIEATESIRAVIKKIILEHKVGSVLDVACGDMEWMSVVLEDLHLTKPGLHYIGADIVEPLIKENQRKFPSLDFRHLDFVRDDLPVADLIICREALQHLPVADIREALARFSRSGARLLLSTIHLRRYGIRNRLNIKPGRCRDRNLLLAPFNLPNPIAIYPEEFGYKDKFIGLWSIPF